MNTLRRSRTGLWSGLLLLLISFFPGPGFGALSEKGQAEPLVLVILPVENISSMYARFLPIREHLESALKQPVVLKVASDYQETIQIIGTGGAQLAYLDPSAFCEAHHDYGVVPLVKTVVQGSATYRSVLVSRSDSPLERIVDTRGSRLALGNRSSSSSYLIPTAMLKEVGIELTDFAAVDYLEEEDRIALSVLTRRYDVGGLSEEVALKYLDSGLKVVALSEAIPQYTIAASASVPESLRTRIQEALLG
ncbi:MAG: phosphate/phosphite/phosphonate ABC transporter substrate-binding protein, partial [Thermodesulfobacteriota bacterium]